MNKLKKVAIVGRMNVGKSTLFNRLSTNIKSLTLDFEGVTRDVIKDIVSWQNVDFELIDTGGLDVKKSQDVLYESVRKLAKDTVENSDLILFVLDGSSGILPQEEELANFLRKLDKPVFLVVNKSDRKDVQENINDFYALGFDKLFPISAQHGLGIGDLLHSIVSELKQQPVEKEELEEEGCKVVLLGKPNVGKSSLMNLLAKQERSIVADMPGTTREPIHENIKFYKENIQLIDTAGVRKKKSVKEDVEELMVKSTFQAVKHADIVLLLLDSSEGRLTDQELKLAFYVFEQGKALVLLFNKQDLIEIDDEAKSSLKDSQDKYDFFLKKIDKLNISCKSGKNIGKVLPLVEKVWKRYNQKIDYLELTDIVKSKLSKTPLYRAEQELIIHRAKQVKVAPMTIVLYVNLPQFFQDSQLAFVENTLRSKFDLKSVPIKFIVRKN